MEIKNKRKVFLINKSFQLSIIGWFSILSMSTIMIFYFTIFHFFYKFKNEAISAGLPPGHVIFTFLNEQKSVMDQVFIVTAVIASLVILIGGLFLSHKIAGPLHRFTQHLKTHPKKNTPPVKFRKDDYFMEIQDAFNDYLNKD